MLLVVYFHETKSIISMCMIVIAVMFIFLGKLLFGVQTGNIASMNYNSNSESFLTTALIIKIEASKNSVNTWGKMIGITGNSVLIFLVC